jgi:hypothetical protein
MKLLFWDQHDFSSCDLGNPELREHALKLGYERSMWFPGGHGAAWFSGDGYETIDYDRLAVVCDEHLRHAAEHDDGPLTYAGQLLPTYENHWIFWCHEDHSDRDQHHITPEQSGQQHLDLIKWLRWKYPNAQLGDFNFPYPVKHWPGSNHYLPGIQYFARISELYDLACPSAYTRWETDQQLAWVVERLKWAGQWDRPVYPFVQPWCNNAEGLRIPVSETYFAQVVAQCRLAPNFAGLQWWTMACEERIRIGQHVPGTTPESILAHHKRMLEIAAEVIG